MSRRSISAGLVLALALAGLPSAGQAEFFTAQRLKDSCVRGYGAERLIAAQWVCFGFIIGAADSALIRQVVCMPGGVTASQLVDVVRKYLNDHPEEGHYPAAYVTELALKKIWSCK